MFDKSAAAVAQIRGLVDQIGKLKTDLADAERALTLTIKNKEVVELTVGKPDTVIAKAKTAADLARNKLSGAQSELVRIFLNEGARYENLRAEAWARTYNEVVLPQAQRFARLTEEFESIVDGIVDLFRPESELTLRFRSYDVAVEEWNALVTELRGPGNAAINATPLSKNLRDSLTVNLRIRDRFEATLTRLKGVLNPPPPPPKPLTEEEVAAIREQQKTALAMRESQMADEDARARLARV